MRIIKLLFSSSFCYNYQRNRETIDRLKNHKRYDIWCKKNNVDHKFLKECLINGFDIHHIDGNHDNNDENNLILIYNNDHHMLLHNIKNFYRRIRNKWVNYDEYHYIKEKYGKECYFLRKDKKLSWIDINKKIPNALQNAKYYALKHNYTWPIKVKTKNKFRIKELKTRSNNDILFYINNKKVSKNRYFKIKNLLITKYKGIIIDNSYTISNVKTELLKIKKH